MSEAVNIVSPLRLWTTLAFVAIVFLSTYALGSAGSYLQTALIVGISISLLFTRGWQSEISGTLLLCAFAVLLGVFAVNDQPGQGGWVSILNFWTLLAGGLLITSLSLAARPDNATFVARLAVLSVVISLLYALCQLYVLHVPIDMMGGPATNRIKSTGSAVIMSFIALIGLKTDRTLWRLAYLASPVIALLLTIIGSSRGPLIVFLLLASVSLFIFAKRKFIAAIVGGVFVLLVWGALMAFPQYLGRLSNLPSIIWASANGAQLADNSAVQRSELYHAGVEAFIRSPWSGYGWRGKAFATFPNADPARINLSTWHLHSDILDFAVSGGVIGLAAYTLILLAPIVGALRSPRDSQRNARIVGCTLLSVGYLGYGAFNAAFGFEYLTVMYIALAAILLGFCRDAPMRALKR